ncbi:TonB-dependent receptor plug domain-containing protein, partial [Roseateles sp.]|uniref:TonB-dependent receptor plug domain-containing protein n=1 Tax=Roseateles sp. TaxID=1971397 RepID=UPI00286CAE30
MKVKQSPIAAAVALTLLSVTLAAKAQQAAAPKGETNQLEQVVVTGIRASQEKSLSVKRNADAHIDVINAEDIGKMPDKNVADSLARLPGVTVTNSASGGSGGFDERDRVSVRGTSPSLTQTLLDGHGVANGDWFVLDQTGAGVGRSVSFSLLPSEIVSRVEVRKSSEASLVEGGTAGSVNIITRKPLDFAKTLTAEASVGAVYADLPSKSDPQLSGLVNFRSEDKTFGVLVQAFSEKRSLRRDGVETLGFNALTKAAAPVLVAAHPDLEGVMLPDLIGSAYFTQTRERKGGLIKGEFKPTKDIDLVLTGFSSKMDADNYNNNYLIAPRPGLINNATLSDYKISTDSKGVKTLTKATFDFAGAGSNSGYHDMISRKSSAESNFLGLEGSWKVNDTLTLAVNGGTSKGKGSTASQDVLETNIVTTKSSYALNGNDAAPSFSFDKPKQGFDWIFGNQNTVVTDKETWGQVDGEYALDAGVLRSLKFGLRGAEHKRYTDPTLSQGPGCA